VGRTSVVVLVALAACIAGSASVAAAGSPKDPTLHRVAADVALAKTLLIVKRDLPAGFRDAGPDTSGNSSDDVCKGVVQPDLHRLVMHADVTSHDFEQTVTATGFTQVSTEATLFRSAREATASMAWFTSLPKATLQACFEAAFRAGLPKSTKTQGFRLDITRRTISDLHLGVWEMGLRFQKNGAWIPVDFVIASYRRGRAIEMLLAVNAGGGLDPALMRTISETITTRLLRAAV
jgi:hypothetical protein